MVLLSGRDVRVHRSSSSSLRNRPARAAETRPCRTGQEACGERNAIDQVPPREPAGFLHETMRLHVTKENELLLPVMDDVSSDDEQAGIIRQMLGHPPPELPSQILIWVFKGQSVTDREGFLRMGMKIFPQERFGGLVQLLSNAVSREDRLDLIRRITELSLTVCFQAPLLSAAQLYPLPPAEDHLIDAHNVALSPQTCAPAVRR